MRLPSHSERLANARDTNFYYSFVFLPAKKRRAIEAVHAFARRCDNAVDAELPPADAARALAACRRDLDLCYANGARAGNELALTPQMAELAEAVARFKIPRPLFDQLIAGLAMDLSVTRYSTFDDLLVYCYGVASTIGLISIQILGYRNPSARVYASHLGVALQLVNILRDLGSDARRGRLYLPLEDLSRFAVPPESVLRGQPDGHFDALVQHEVERARGYFSLARQSLSPEDRRSLRAAEIMAAIYWKILARVAERGGHVLQERVRLSPGCKLRTAVSVYMGFEWYKREPEAQALNSMTRE